MADQRSRRTREPSAELTKMMSEADALREHVAALEARVIRLEAELSTLGASVAKMAAPVAVSLIPRPVGKPADNIMVASRRGAFFTGPCA